MDNPAAPVGLAVFVLVLVVFVDKEWGFWEESSGITTLLRVRCSKGLACAFHFAVFYLFIPHLRRFLYLSSLYSYKYTYICSINTVHRLEMCIGKHRSTAEMKLISINVPTSSITFNLAEMLESQQLVKEQINLNTLPLDILINILEGLDYNSLLAICRVRQGRSTALSPFDLFVNRHVPPSIMWRKVANSGLS
jgi:hypothetical protein